MSDWEDEAFQTRWNWKLWKGLLRFTKPYTKHLVALGLVMLAVGAIDTSFPYLTKVAVDTFLVPRSMKGIEGFLALYGGAMLAQCALVWSLIWVAGWIEQGLIHDLRQAGFDRLMDLSFSYYDKTPGGWILARLTSDATRLGQVISWGIVDMVWGAAMMLAITIVLFVLNPLLAAITLSVLPPLAWVSVVFQKTLLTWYRQVKKLGSEVSAAFSEGIQGARSSKVLGREDGNRREFGVRAGNLRDASVRSAWFGALYLPVVLTLASLGTALALSFGAPMVLAGALSLGTLVAFASYTVQFFEPVRELARVLGELQQAQTSAERLLALVEAEPEIRDRPGLDTSNEPPLVGRVEFHEVSFSYVPGQPILERFQLVVEPGQSIALVGETGSGKSTIINLLCRFYEPTSGQVLIDGVDTRDRSQHWLHSRLGYVLQTPQLFRGTVRDNIRYGRLTATDAEVEEAAKQVSATEFIQELEKGFDTDIGEGGSRLSTGQKQLVSLARAVLADPALFLLDEATSSVDTETERLIQLAVEKLLHGRTSFLIAHRLSTVRGADRILLLEKGRILEDGNHSELMARRGRYFELYTEQFLDEREKQELEA
ncbi:MAG: ABC transporter ATP-binding protein [Spirochaetales bacterium]